MIDWAQTLTILGGVAAMWFGCFTVLREDMRIMREEHREDMKEMRTEHRESLAKMDIHWREMFTYMNNKIDDTKNRT